MKVITFLIFFIMIFSCAKKEEKIIAQVDNNKLLLEDFECNFQENDWKNMKIEEKQEYIQDWIQLTLLSQEADKLKISEIPEIKSKIKSAEMNIKSNALIAQRFSDLMVSEDELFNYYKLHKSKFLKKSEEYRLQRILITDESKLDMIRDEIKDTSFDEAAKKYSEEDIGRTGGFVGFISKKNAREVIWNTIIHLIKGRYKTVQIGNAFHIVRYTQTRLMAVEKNFSEVKEEIREIVIQNKKEEIFENLVEDLKMNADIIVNYEYIKE
ncbi:MAG: peptidyl-prolyl cis-trans isomerase [Armatimonadetes bacterium]|nr:peptidyl-prolyl cis-trans isomerase [Armatimonadota bacterium]